MTKQLSPVIEQYREEIKALAQKNGLANVRVFGSMARGDDSPASDIDLLVDLQPDFPDGFALIRMKDDVEDLTGRNADVGAESSLRSFIKDKILKECIAI